MKKVVIATLALVVGLIAAATAVEARSGKYCLKNSPGPGDCKYSSYRQCQASASGTGAICVRNYGPRR